MPKTVKKDRKKVHNMVETLKSGGTIQKVDSGYRTPKEPKPAPLPIPSPTQRLQSGWDAEMEARQSPTFRYAGENLSTVDAARKRAGDRASSARAQLERDNRVGKSGVIRGYRVGNVSADENESGIAKQRYDLASKRKEELEEYFNDRIAREDQKKRTDKINAIVSNAVQNKNYKDIARRGTFSGEPSFSDKTKSAVAYINNKTKREKTGFDDIDRDMMIKASGLTDFEAERYDTLTEDEKNIIRYYAALGDYGTISEYLKSKETILNARAQTKRNTDLKEFSEKHPIAGSAANIASVYGTLSPYLENAGQMVKNTVTGEYTPTDTNSEAFVNVHGSNATAEGVGNAAYNAARDTFGSETAGNVARDLSGIGLSIGQNVALLPLGNTGALAAMGASAAGASTLDALERGATPQQAFGAGTASGLIEAATEKLPIDRIFKIAGTSPSGVKDIITNVLKQMGTEAGEESISNIAGNIADRVIMGDKSNYELLVAELVKQGISQQEAEKQAFTQLYVVDTLKSAAGGALSGGVMGAGASAVGMARRGAARNQINRDADAVADPLKARMKEIEAERSSINVKMLPGGIKDAMNDRISKEYAKLKTMVDTVEADRSQKLAAIDNAEKTEYTDNQEYRANWNDENRANWREINGGEEAESTTNSQTGKEAGSIANSRAGEAIEDASKTGEDTGRAGGGAVSHLDVFDEGDAGESSGSNAGGESGIRQKTSNSYKETGGSRRIETKSGIKYQFNAVGRESASQKALHIADAWTDRGFHAIIYDGQVDAIDQNGNARIGSADATVLDDGTILLRNDAKLPEAEILAHEPIHYYKKMKPEIYKPIVDTIEFGGIDLLNPYGLDVIDKLDKAYKKNHGSYIDLDNLPRIYEELIAQISGHHANDPEFAREMFSPLINDYDGLIAAIENAHNTFSQQNAQASEKTGAFSMPENGERGGKIMDDSVGAMVHDPNSYSALQGKYGTIQPGENPSRVVDVPKQTSDDTKTRQFVRTVMEAESTPDELIPEIEEMIKAGKFSYTPVSNEKTMQKAKSRIEYLGFDDALKEWKSIAFGNKPLKADGIALGEYIFSEAAKSGDVKLSLETAQELSSLLTQAGRTVQAARILKKMTPEGRLMAAQKSVDYLKRQYVDQLGERVKDIELPDDIAKQILQAKSEEEINISEKALADYIAEQIPATMFEKWNNWRYLSMLFNPRTHVRNILGNSFMIPVRKLKDAIKIPLEGIRGKINPETKTEKTASLFTSKEMRDIARGEFKVARESMNTGDKYGASYINTRRKIYDHKWLEAVRKFNSAALEGEDVFFMRSAFVSAYAQKAKASGYESEFLKSDTEDARRARASCRDYAMDEALKATFRDTNALAEALSKTSRINKTDSGAIKAGKIVMEGILPFKKTPMNIVKRGVEYSPAGLLNSIFGSYFRVKRAGRGLSDPADIKTAKSAQVTKEIDKLASGLTGTGLAMLGAWMMASEIIRVTGGDDKKENEFDEMNGAQDYAIEIGGHSYTIDWASPAAMSLFVGAEAYRQLNKEEGVSFSQMLKAMSSVAEPIIDMSMMQGLENTIATVSGSDNKIADVVTNAALSYVGQAVPTLLGQIARTIDGTRRSTYYPSGGNVPKNLGKFANKTIAKLPIASKNIEPYLDAWGREDVNHNDPFIRTLENVFSPGYYSEKNETSVDREIERLVSATSNNDLYPKRAQTNVRVNDKTYYLQPKELTKFQKTMGQTAFNTLEKLFKNENYKNFSDDQKANIVSSIYEYSRALAQKQFIDNRTEIDKKPDKVIENVDGAFKVGIDVPTYFMERENLKDITTDDGNGGIRTMQKLDAQLRPEQAEYFKKKEALNTDGIQYNSNRKRRILMNSNFTAKQKAYLDKTFVEELKNPIDYTDENSFYFSQMSDAKKEKWPEVTRHWSNMSKVDYYNVIDGVSELGKSPKKAVVINKLRTLGFSKSGAYSFYKVAIAPQKKK